MVVRLAMRCLSPNTMNAFTRFLRVVAPIFILVGALHLFLGLRADVLLGARLPPRGHRRSRARQPESLLRNLGRALRGSALGLRLQRHQVRDRASLHPRGLLCRRRGEAGLHRPARHAPRTDPGAHGFRARCSAGPLVLALCSCLRGLPVRNHRGATVAKAVA